jgi:hypothetical protein
MLVTGQECSVFFCFLFFNKGVSSRLTLSFSWFASDRHIFSRGVTAKAFWHSEHQHLCHNYPFPCRWVVVIFSYPLRDVDMPCLHTTPTGSDTCQVAFNVQRMGDPGGQMVLKNATPDHGLLGSLRHALWQPITSGFLGT